jgi:hypothetical protein
MTTLLERIGLVQNGKLDERLNSSGGANICFDMVPLVPLDISYIDVGDDHPLEKAIRLTIKSGASVPTSSVSAGPSDFYEEVNFYLRGMGEHAADAKEIKEMLAEMLGQ